MRPIALLLAIALMAVVLASTMPASSLADHASQDFGLTLPPDYRDWKLVSVAHEAGNLNDLRGILGNDIAIQAYRQGKLPFPDGSIIARVAWKYVASPENNKAFGREQSFVAGEPTNVQLMVKDSKKYASTGGWGFGQFKDGKADPAAKLETCFPCHEPATANDLVFTRYARNP